MGGADHAAPSSTVLKRCNPQCQHTNICSAANPGSYVRQCNLANSGILPQPSRAVQASVDTGLDCAAFNQQELFVLPVFDFHCQYSRMTPTPLPYARPLVASLAAAERSSI
ncbi:hypothetical protein EVAR_41707_1 [Eumeta japonica]|uniref:Uncharacterized protein n=1 Tax=Eumeta variegata TaxID=151549 RepID=A0A4C1VQJ9_EUMVA|nr:hypothetical protein EVAR_41707_1 [Eumeta japonica]